MSKKLLSKLGIPCLLAASLSANATLVTDVHSVDNWFNTHKESRSWTHDITDDGFDIGDTVHSASLSFDLYDDKDIWLEKAIVVIENVDLMDGGIFEIDTAILGLNVGLAGLLSLNIDGTLDASITRLAGDFGLRDVVLTANITEAVAASVPEPGSLALLGLGLAGFGFSRRNKA